MEESVKAGMPALALSLHVDARQPCLTRTAVADHGTSFHALHLPTGPCARLEGVAMARS